MYMRHDWSVPLLFCRCSLVVFPFKAASAGNRREGTDSRRAIRSARFAYRPQNTSIGLPTLWANAAHSGHCGRHEKSYESNDSTNLGFQQTWWNDRFATPKTFQLAKRPEISNRTAQKSRHSTQPL